ncbi:type 2 lanthipeptide synthetase LanM family protein [Nocardiopsis terrae]
MTAIPLEHPPRATASWKVAELPWQRSLRTEAPERLRAGNPDPHPRAHRRWTRLFGAEGIGPAADALGFGADRLRDLVEGPDLPGTDRVPRWVARADHHLELGRRPLVPGEEYLVQADELGLLSPAADLVRGYQRALFTDTARAVADVPRLSALPRLLAGSPPVETLDALMGRTAVLELNVARVRGDLTGATPRERFEHHLERSATDRFQRELWSEYTVLLHQVDTLLHGWARARLEFTERLAADLPALDSLRGAPLGPVESVGFGAGDTHRGGRSVAVVGFSGPSLVYKPRPLHADAAWKNVVDWFNARVPRHDLRAPDVLLRPDHGWATFVDHEPCATGGGDAFYWRLGALLALNHALCGTDLHHENLIASGDHPVMIDMEALFHGAGAERPTELCPAERLLGEGVVRVGLLPTRMVVRSGGRLRSLDASGVSADTEHESVVPVSIARGQGTDEMAFGAEHVTVRGTATHRPHTEQGPLDPLDHQEAFVRGFTEAYWYVVDDRASWLAEGGLLDGFRRAEIRHIARPTSFYGAVLSDSTHPDFLRDGRDHDRALGAVARGADGTRPWERLAAAELAELRAGDIPYFSCRPDSTSVTSGRGTVVPGFLTEAPAEAVHRRVRGLGRHDLDVQRSLIRRTFDSLRPARDDGSVRTLPLTGSPRGGEAAVDEALRLAHELCDEAVEDGDDLGWIGLELVDERFWRLGAARTDLYSGLAGVGLFLSRTAQVTGDGRVNRYAERVARSLAARAGGIRRAFDRDRSAGTLAQNLRHHANPGGFGPLGGLVYHLAHAGDVHGREEWLDAAERCLPVLRAHVDHDTVHDLLSGSAGALLAALALHRVRPSSGALALAEHAGAALLERAVPQETGVGWPGRGTRAPLSGVSHGNAGVAHALLQLNEAAPRPEYVAAAEAALAYEDTLLDLDLDNWLDLRPDGAGPCLTWCHGAPGIGLARAAALALPGARPLSMALRRGVAAAERSTLALHLPETGGIRTLGQSGLCHGDLGNLEFLLSAASLRADTAAQDRVHRAVSTLVDHGRAFGWGTSPLPREGVPGLMYGRAGIGYNLLRLALPGRVPSVLLLDAP